MECGGMSGDMVNQDVESINTLKANNYLWRCMMYGDMLNLFLLCISDHSQDKEHKDIADGMDEYFV
jgi:hypothetical protein